MARRLVRRAPRISGLRPIAESISRTMSQRNTGYSNPRPTTIPQTAYLVLGPAVPITGGYNVTALNSSGAGTAYTGPQGVGTVWYPQSAVIGTSTGASDAATCTIYLSAFGPNFSVPASQIIGQSYAGGGDTVGLSVPPVRAGYFIVAIWQGGVSGAQATLQVYGTQQSLAT